jgi:organic radical activating enzyme
MSLAEILAEVNRYAPCDVIVWTGGEPTVQLTGKALEYFREFYNCIETNGTYPVPGGIDYIACSPKVPVWTLNKNFIRLDEIRYPVKKGDALPDIDLLPEADHYFVSPIDVHPENADYCLKLIKENPQWRLSVQIHRLLNIR